VPVLRFPTERIVGTLDWDGSWSDVSGPVLARGEVPVPDGVEVQLSVEEVTGSRPVGNGTWELQAATAPVPLDFLRDLPPDALQSMTIQGAAEESIEAVTHLAAGLRHLVLAHTGFSDAVLPAVAALPCLTDLQTWGNRFTDEGVQILAGLSDLQRLYLEEASLSVAAFAFAEQLPRLVHLGLQDVPLSDEELSALRGRLPGVRVDR
jgi:hypothetical protein